MKSIAKESRGNPIILGKARRNFTLTELVLSLSISVLLGSVSLLRVQEMLGHYRFTRDLERLAHELNATRHIAAIARCDIAFHLRSEGGKLLCSRQTEELLHLPAFFETVVAFGNLSHFAREDGEVIDRLTVTFTGTGWVGEEQSLRFRSRGMECWLRISQRAQVELFPQKGKMRG